MNEHNGTFTDWKLKLWGESIDANAATLLPMPEETDDDDHDSTTTIAATTTSVPAVILPTSVAAQPTDHPDRPVNAKPTSTEDEEVTPTDNTAPAATTSGGKSGWLPSFFPTFGVSARTLVWIYGSLGLIIIFCSGLGVYFYLARRKRLRNSPRDEYEFDLIEEDEAEGLNGSGAKKGGKRRAGELYDAFAAGSDEDAFSDDDEEAYGDRHVIGEDDEDDGGDGEKRRLSEKS